MTISFADFPIAAATPMMQQYLKVKKSYPEYLLMYRMGDFYEFFFEDAVKAASLLDIALTKRDKQNDVAMCGIPFHATDSYIPKLLKAGEKIAICDQMETPEQAKKRGYKAVVKREVTRIITPGTLTEDNLLEQTNSNYLLTVVCNKQEIALAWIDISTNEFNVTKTNINELATDIAVIAPKEILLSTNLVEHKDFIEIFSDYKRILTTQVDSFFGNKRAEKNLLSNYNLQNLDSLSNLEPLMLAACGATIEYLKVTNLNDLPNLRYPKLIETSQYMRLDKATRQNLELDKDSTGSHTNSLFGLLNNCVTSFGSRFFKSIYSRPLLSPQKIEDRLNKLEFFQTNSELSTNLQDILKNIPDIERSLNRLAFGRGGPRDVISIASGLDSALKFAGTLDEHNNGDIPDYIISYSLLLGGHEEIIRDIAEAINEDAPLLVRDGNFIRPGYHPKIDELRDICQNSQNTLDKIKEKYKKITGVNNIKINRNNVLGLFIDVSSQHATKLMQNSQFIHRQTLANNVRFTTVELQEIESEIINAKDKIISLEIQLFEEICQNLLSVSAKILATTAALSALDVYIGLSILSNKYNLCRPKIDTSFQFNVTNGRHLIVEKNLHSRSEDFTANDCCFSKNNNIWLITGPNMAGKSTFLRQNALIVIMAQIGCFVPAEHCHIGIVDRVFSRIGASDDLASGRSTFMVEMSETATILRQATKRSLIILDEIGRGTSTYDGLAIAWSVVEFIHNKIQAKTLFATHYHELTALQNSLENVTCYKVAVKEWENEIIFLHKLLKGAADKSYGINVAELAGFPKTVTNRAKVILKQIEQSNDKNGMFNHSGQYAFNLLEKPPENPAILNKLTNIDLDEITPRQALSILEELKSTHEETV